MKQQRIEPKNIHFTESKDKHGDVTITARLSIEMSGRISAEMARQYYGNALAEMKAELTRKIMLSVYGDVWELAQLARASFYRRDPLDMTPMNQHPTIQFLNMIGAIGAPDAAQENL